ncbi:MAG: hypothetical protein V3W41_21375 [Planctomycetota bacterium]
MINELRSALGWIAISMSLFGISCAGVEPGKTGEPMVGSNLETIAPIEVVGPRRRVAVYVRPDSQQTVVQIGSTTVIFRDHAGYHGRITPSAGWLRIGDLNLNYRQKKLQIRSRRGWANFDLGEGLALYAGQDGQIGRSIFRP